ncbi:hypothetical protein MYX78_11395 [Acidobacteria bacterium AH-259-G07]|nr:hypothetical protein [Acidobacteria bacterium AH-259-G07]
MDTRDLLLAKLDETGDRPEEVACHYRLGGGKRHHGTLQELPAGQLGSFLALSDKYLYVQRANERIDAWDMMHGILV